MIAKGIMLVCIVINVVCIVKLGRENKKLTKRNDELTKRKNELISTNIRLSMKTDKRIKESVYDDYKNMVVCIADKTGNTTSILLEGASYFKRDGVGSVYEIYDAADRVIAAFPSSEVLYILKVKDDAKDDVNEKNCQA